MKTYSIILCAFLAISGSVYGQDKAVQQKKEAVHIYDPKANADADLNAAIKKAKAEKKNVFVQVGGNWCVWCIAFHNMVNANPELKGYLDSHFEKVLVNYSPENKNEAMMARLKYPGRFGFPVFVILNGEGEVLHIENSAYLEEGKGHSVKKVTDFLKNWTYAAVDPATYKK